MLINLETLCINYAFTPKGVLHVGAHEVEELEVYNKIGVKKIVWIEGNPKIFEKIKCLENENNKIFNYLVADKDDDEIDFFITNNGQSSSILKLEKHLDYHPQVYVVDKIKMKTKKLDSIFKLNEIKFEDYDFINIDIQGAELLALKGFEEGLKHIKYVYTEVNTGEVYKNCAKLDELDAFLLDRNFERKEINMTRCEWGDAFYVKKN